MFPALMKVLSGNYKLYITMPVGVVIGGLIAFELTELLSDKFNTSDKSISQKMIDETSVNIKEKIIMSDVLDRNLSPSLQGDYQR